MTAAFAFQADVRTEPHDRPLIGAARVRLAQAEQVVKLKVGKHVWVFNNSRSPAGTQPPLEIIPRRQMSLSL